MFVRKEIQGIIYISFIILDGYYVMFNRDKLKTRLMIEWF